MEKTWSIRRQEPTRVVSGAVNRRWIVVIGGRLKQRNAPHSAPGMSLYPIHCVVPLTSWQHSAAGTSVESGANTWVVDGAIPSGDQ